jgi:hypothetical protein
VVAAVTRGVTAGVSSAGVEVLRIEVVTASGGLVEGTEVTRGTDEGARVLGGVLDAARVELRVVRAL